MPFRLLERAGILSRIFSGMLAITLSGIPLIIFETFLDNLSANLNFGSLFGDFFFLDVLERRVG
jgi:hypothetical protein